MADAEDLKSSGDFSSWGFDSPPGHHKITNVYAAISMLFFQRALYVPTFFESEPLLTPASRVQGTNRA